MKTLTVYQSLTVYQWTTDDPSVEHVRYALNRLAAFQITGEGGDDPTCINRVLKGNQFSSEDIFQLANYLRTLATRARDKWYRLTTRASPTEDDLLLALAECIFQAAAAAEQSAHDLVEYFKSQRPATSATPGRKKG